MYVCIGVIVCCQFDQNLGVTPHDINVVKWRQDAQTDEDDDDDGYSCQ